MRKLLAPSLLTISLLASPAMAGDTTTATESAPASESVPAPAPAAEATAPRSKNESWYWGFSLGYSALQYTGNTKALAEQIGATPGATRMPIMFDFGFYWPLANQKTALGVGMNGSSDTYDLKNDKSFSATYSTVGFSAQHFFGTNIGDGFFLRGDVGPALISVNDTTGNTTTTTNSKTGIGGMAGIGYALPVSDDTRLLFGAQYAYRIVSGDKIGAFNVNVGMLF